MKLNKILLFVLTFFLVYACMKNDDVEGNPLEPVLVKTWFDSEIRAHSPNFISKKEIKWDWKGIEPTTNSLLVHSIESKDIRSFYKLEISAIDDDYEAVIYMYNPTAPSIDGSFTGREITFSLDGEIICSKFLRGVKKEQKIVSKKELLSTSARFSEDDDNGSGNWVFDNDLDAFALDEAVVTFQRNSLNASSSYSFINWSSINSYINNNFSYSNYYGNTSTIYYSSSSWTAGTTGTLNNKIEDRELDPCSQGILNVLKNSNSIESIINQFADEDSQFNWIIETSPEMFFEEPKNDAETGWASYSENTYITKIGENYKGSATKLSIARTIVHEAIHAYILSYLDSSVGDLKRDFPTLFKELVSKKYGNPNNNQYFNIYQHQEIARNYVSAISGALAEWDDDQNSLQYYEDLAWGGLFETQIFKETPDLTVADRKRILEVNIAEDKNLSNAKGSPCK